MQYKKLIDGEFVLTPESELIDGDRIKKEVVTDVWAEMNYFKPTEIPVITIDILLDKTQGVIGEEITYNITFSEPITVEEVVPISITDRNGNHVTNLGCTVTDGASTGAFTMDRAGDFTVTNEAINFHHTVIEAELRLTSQPWLRVYQ